MKVAVIGTGYVGLVVGSCLAETGNDVICVDIDVDRIARLQSGEIPIYEPGLKEHVVRNTAKNRLKFSTDTPDAVRESQIVFIAVPTPMDEDGSADMQHVLNAAANIAEGINAYKIIVDKSTVPVGTAAKVRKVIAGLTDLPFDVVSNPEFLKEGNAIDDFMYPNRVIIGCESERAEAVMRDLYAPFVRTGHPIISMRIQSAELTKYAANSILAARISFMNEIARMCELVGADIDEVRLGIGSDQRIGSSFLFPGMGFGGSCFPKDLRALEYTARSLGLELLTVQAANQANLRQKEFMPEKIARRFQGELSGKRFAVWGLSFKANTDDVRESPVLSILDMLVENQAEIRVYDPQAIETTRGLFGDSLKYYKESYDAVEDADALVIGTEWNEFRRPDFDRIKSLMRQHIVFDGRNLYNVRRMRELGFEYYSVGRP